MRKRLRLDEIIDETERLRDKVERVIFRHARKVFGKRAKPSSLMTIEALGWTLRDILDEMPLDERIDLENHLAVLLFHPHHEQEVKLQ